MPEPAREFVRVAQITQPQMGVNERFLGNILGIIGIAERLIRRRQHRAPVPFHQPLRRKPISRKSAPDQFAISFKCHRHNSKARRTRKIDHCDIRLFLERVDGVRGTIPFRLARGYYDKKPIVNRIDSDNNYVKLFIKCI